MVQPFLEKLAAAVRRNDSRLCVGLDPDLKQIPGGDVAAFNRRIIEATADLVCCYKPNLAFYEALGQPGYDALRATLAAIPGDIPVLIDAKRNDVPSTAEGYATALFDVLGADAVTVNPYLGEDSLEPFLRRAEKGIFILCRNSNPGAVDLQDLSVNDGSGNVEPLYLAVASRVNAWNRNGNAGLVVGATYPSELALVRRRCPELPILVPGVGSQGGILRESVLAANNDAETGFLINSSRGVIYAGAPGQNIEDGVRHAARELRNAINDVLRLPVQAQGSGVGAQGSD